MKISIIAALDEQGVIGLDGDLPWRLPEDTKFFRRTTTGHTLIVGRVTFDSIGGALPNRTTIVLSRSADYAPDGAIVVADLQAALDLARQRGESEVFVAGGAKVYAEALPLADRLVLTRVAARVDGDTRFPSWDPALWKLVSETHHAADDRHAFAFVFEEYVRAG